MDHVPILNALVIEVTLPATVFIAIAKAPAIPGTYALLPVLFIVTELCAIGLAYALGRAIRASRATQGMLMLTGAFGNTAFLGYPIMLAVMPKMFPAGVLLDEFGMMILMYVCAAVITARFGAAAGEGEPVSLLGTLGAFARSPIFLAVIGGIVAHFARGHMPAATHAATAMLMQILAYLGQATTPLVLLALGASLRPRAAASPVLFLSGALKLIACPILMWCLFRIVGLSGDLLHIGVLQASMPTGVVVSVLCSKHGLDGAKAGGAVCATTAISLITIPLMQAFLR